MTVTRSIPGVSTTVQDIQDHATILHAFHAIRSQVSPAKWAAVVDSGVNAFRKWATSLEGSADDGSLEGNDPGILVLMVWHTYMLNPLKYQHDTLHVYPGLSKINEYPLRLVASRVRKMGAGAAYALQSSDETIPPPPSAALQDLAAAVMRQAEFIQKVVNLGWSADCSEAFAQRCLERYHGFLEVIAAEPDSCPVPTLDIDLAWHTHQLQGGSYRSSTQRYLGYILNHDDTIPDSKLAIGFQKTGDIWKALFGREYLAVGPLGPSMIAGCAEGACNGKCGGCGALQRAGCGEGACNGGCGAVIAACSAGGCDGNCGSCGAVRADGAPPTNLISA